MALALMRLIKPPAQIVGGRIVFDGVDLLSLPEDQMRTRRLADIALVTQGAMNSLNPVMRVRHQMVDAMQAHGIHLSKHEWENRLASLLRSVNLRPDVADLYPHQLSGGMKQRVLVEVAAVRDLFARPQHPYTRLLMDSLPSLRQRGSYEVAPA